MVSLFFIARALQRRKARCAKIEWTTGRSKRSEKVRRIYRSSKNSGHRHRLHVCLPSATLAKVRELGEPGVQQLCASVAHSFSLNSRVALVRHAVHIFVAFKRERERERVPAYTISMNASLFPIGRRTKFALSGI